MNDPVDYKDMAYALMRKLESYETFITELAVITHTLPDYVDPSNNRHILDRIKSQFTKTESPKQNQGENNE